LAPDHEGILINFEGIDRCGKSTQVARLEKKLQEANIEFETLREPGSTAVSEQIRRILLSVESGDIDSRCELMLYSAARAQLVSEKIVPRLESGKTIIIDRYFDSTTAYQGYGRKLPIDIIENINQLVSQERKPNLTIIIDISPEDAVLRRDEAGRDRLERSSLDFFDRVRNGYLEMAKSDSRFVVIDGNKSIEEIGDEVWAKIAKIIDK
jgi:dTMP kinase